MSGHLDALRIRAGLGRDAWGIPRRFGPDGWVLDDATGAGRVIVTAADYDGTDVVHASISWADHDPSYADLARLHRAVWGRTGWAVQVFAPAAEHVNIHQHALHLWGRLDGARMHPDFTYGAGSI